MNVDKETRRVFVRGGARAAVATLAVLAAYFLLPLDRFADVGILVLLPILLALFVVVVVFEVRGILRAEFPTIRAVEALARDIPLFLCLFAASYYVMGQTDPSWFSEKLSRLDALYFAVTVFATVGFGDITGVSPEARAAVMIQMTADLVVVGIGLRVILTAIRAGRQRQGRDAAIVPDPSDPTGN
jgi:voltage-gated potassium channel